MSSYDSESPGEQANKEKMSKMHSGVRLRLDGALDSNWEVVANDGESVIARNEIVITKLGMWDVVRGGMKKNIHGASDLVEGDIVYAKMAGGSQYRVDAIDGEEVKISTQVSFADASRWEIIE